MKPQKPKISIKLTLALIRMIGVVLSGGKIIKEATLPHNGDRLKRILHQELSKDFMFNYRVENLVELLQELKKNGDIIGEIEEYHYGKVDWILYIDGNKIELWEPKDEGFL